MCQKLPYCARHIDTCIEPLIKTINSNRMYRTLLSCCGHGIYPKSVVVLNRDTNRVFEWFSGIELDRYYKNGHVKTRYYCRDKHDYFFIPEITHRKGIKNE